MTTTDDRAYAFGNARNGQRERLRALEQLLDPDTIRQLATLGVDTGWRCLEVGAGGGSIAAWLCDQVGAEGSVVATDLDLTVLGELSRANLEVRVHDVVADQLPVDEYDLIHARLVVSWLADPLAVLRRLRSALRPAGVLLIEEMDFSAAVTIPEVDEPTRQLFDRVFTVHNALLEAKHGFDLTYGARLIDELTMAGLKDVGSECRRSTWRGGELGTTALRFTLEQLREPVIASGHVGPDDVDAAIALCADPHFGIRSQWIHSAWGWRLE